MVVYADEYKEVNNAQSGNIVAVTGLKVCLKTYLFFIKLNDFFHTL